MKEHPLLILVRGNAPGVARFRGYMVEVSRNRGRHVYLGRWERLATYTERTRRGRGRFGTKTHIVAAWGSPGVFYNRAAAATAIRNSQMRDQSDVRCMGREDAIATYRIIPVVLEVKLRERAPIGYIADPAIAAAFRELSPRKTRRRKTWRKRDLVAA